MNERVIQFRVGIMVLATLIITGILVILFSGEPDVFKKKNTYYIRFPDAPGVSHNTPIQMSGIVIGRVERVELAKEGGAIVTARIDANREIRRNQVCRISTSLLGDAVLRFVRSNDPNLQDTPIEPDSVISGVVAPDPIQVVSDLQQRLAGAIGSVSRTSDDLDQVVQRIGGLLKGNDQRIERIIVETDETMAMGRKAVANMNEVAGDPEVREKLRQSIEQMPELLRETRETVARMNQSFNLLDRNLQNVEGFTRPLGERGQSVITRLDESVRKFDLVMDQMLKFSQEINSQQGTLGQLLNNPDLYNNLNEAAMNVEELTQRLRPIVDDARVFSDKIARHPEVLGVRGAIERRPGIK